MNTPGYAMNNLKLVTPSRISAFISSSCASAKIGDDAMKRVIANRFAGGFLHPGIESRSQRLTFVLDGEIDQRCRPAESCGARAGFEIIRARSPAERHVKMGMHVDSAGKHILARRIDNLPRILSRQALADGGNLSIADRDVACVSVGCSGYATVNDDGVKAHGCVFSSGGEVQILC